MRTDQTVTRTRVLDGPHDYLIVAVLCVTAAAGGGTWITGQLAGLLFRGTWPPVTFAQALAAAAALPGHLGDPRRAWPAAARGYLPGPAGFTVAGVLVAAVLAGMAVAALRWTGGRRPHRGMATHGQLKDALTEDAVIARGPVIRPSLAGQKDIKVTDVGVRVGRSVPARTRLAISAEDSVLLVAAPRQGKTSQVIIPWLHDWPGAALVTSVRLDVLLSTIIPRGKRGPALVMAPTGMIDWPDKFSWCLASGCESFDKARARADVMVTVGKPGTSSDSNDGGFFGLNATNLLAGWLHAAALSGGSANDVLKWAFDERLDNPIRILATHPGAAEATAAMLDSLYRLPADTTRSSLWATAQTAVAPLLAPAAREVFTPPPGQGTDLAAFLRAGGTCYLMADERRASALAPVVAAFVDDLLETAKTIADESPQGRLDPAFGVLLDEVANIVPLPQLPALMSFAGGTGIFVTAVLQSLAQARGRWGHDAAEMLWGAATVKVILGGLAGDELRQVSELAGEYRETLITWQRGQSGHSLSSTLQDRKAMPPEQIRTLSSQRREALVIHATTPPVKARMTRHYEGPRKDEFAASVMEARTIAGLDAGRLEGR
jgi:type IV secretion system protein VirD4